MGREAGVVGRDARGTLAADEGVATCASAAPASNAPPPLVLPAVEAGSSRHVPTSCNGPFTSHARPQGPSASSPPAAASPTATSACGGNQQCRETAPSGGSGGSPAMAVGSAPSGNLHRTAHQPAPVPPLPLRSLCLGAFPLWPLDGGGEMGDDVLRMTAPLGRTLQALSLMSFTGVHVHASKCLCEHACYFHTQTPDCACLCVTRYLQASAALCGRTCLRSGVAATVSDGLFRCVRVLMCMQSCRLQRR